MNPIDILASHLIQPNSICRLVFSDNLSLFPTECCTYIILFPDGGFYVGSSTRFKMRINQHRGYLRSKKHINIKLQKLYDSVRTEDQIEIYFVQLDNKIIGKILEQKIIDDCFKLSTCSNMSESAFYAKGNFQSDAIEKLCRTISTEEHRAKVSVNTTKIWQREGYRTKMLDSLGTSIVVDGVTYPSIREASRILGRCAVSLSKNMVNGEVTTSDIKPYTRRVHVNGIVYSTLQSAAADIGIKSNTLIWRCKSNAEKWAGHYYLD